MYHSAQWRFSRPVPQPICTVGRFHTSRDKFKSALQSKNLRHPPPGEALLIFNPQKMKGSFMNAQTAKFVSVF
jgi:hypothetical protein